MKKDNWNIKNKVIDFRDFIKQTVIDSEIVKIAFEEAFKKILTTRCVTEENVEILRQKLIEDLKWKGGDATSEEEMIKIINKRFGVK